MNIDRWSLCAYCRATSSLKSEESPVTPFLMHSQFSSMFQHTNMFIIFVAVAVREEKLNPAILRVRKPQASFGTPKTPKHEMNSESGKQMNENIISFIKFFTLFYLACDLCNQSIVVNTHRCHLEFGRFVSFY